MTLAVVPRSYAAGAVRLAVIGGRAETGRSDLARSLAGRVGAELISIDQVQHELEQSNSIAGDNDVLGDGWCAVHSATWRAPCQARRMSERRRSPDSES